MKKAFTLVTIFVLLLVACTSEKKTSFLSTANIRTQLFTINPAKETKIIGARGGIFLIPAGAFEGTSPVTIELKEVYAPIEILSAGLTTESNGELLESGGMFYINAKRDGKELELKKEITGSIPSNYINDSMKLFKGEVKEDGNVNWVDPGPLETDSTSIDNCIEAGRLLFWYNCASCHSISKKLTGPAIAGAEKKVSRQLYYDFIHNPVATARKSKYYKDLIDEYNGVLMTAFPGLSNKDIDCIIEYTNAALTDSSLLQKPTGLELNAVSSPCGTDTIYIDTLPTGINTNLAPFVEEPFKEEAYDSLSNPTNTAGEGLRNGFTDYIATENIDRYNFRISTLGWFNVDAYFQPLEGTTIVELFVDTDFEAEHNLDIHIFLPAKKLLTVGVYNDSDGLFHFEKYKGQIPLYLDDKAVVFAVTSIGEKLYYGISSFNVKHTQTIRLSIKETDKESLDKAFRKMNIDGIDLDVITKKKIVTEIPCNDSMYYTK